MKTAISINDGLLHEADETARQMGLSRSRLFATAVGDFLQRHRQERMLRQLNEVYSEGPTAEEKRIVRGMKKKSASIVKDRW